MQQPIDFVLMWVDGSDPAWQREKQRYQPATTAIDARAVRYRDWDNLMYWFRAVEAFTPWVNKVHFVTWGHTPKWLNPACEKLNIVKHEDFIPQAYLPTFCSRSIELNLHRIPGLAEQFTYFNDDMFILQPLEPSYFFQRGLPCDYAVLAPYPNDSRETVACIASNDMEIINTTFKRKSSVRQKPLNWINPVYRSMNRYTLCSLAFPFFPGFWGSHLPNDYLKSTFETVWAKEFETLNATCLRKFHDRRDVNQWLMRYWQLASNQFVPRSPRGGKYLCVKDNTAPVEAVIKSQACQMVCLNDNEKISDFEAAKGALQRAFEAILPNKSMFER